MCRRAVGRLIAESEGQTLLEAAFALPVVLLIALAIVDVGSAQLDSHTVTRLTREGSNLISRNTSLEDAAQALQSMSNGPVDFDTNATVIFSVLKRGATTGTANYDKLVLYQRYEYGALAASSRLQTGGGSFGPGPDYIANNSDSDTSLRVANLSPTLVTVRGGLVYVTEVFCARNRLTSLANFGVGAPEALYSIAYF